MASLCFPISLYALPRSARVSSLGALSVAAFRLSMALFVSPISMYSLARLLSASVLAGSAFSAARNAFSASGELLEAR